MIHLNVLFKVTTPAPRISEASNGLLHQLQKISEARAVPNRALVLWVFGS